MESKAVYKFEARDTEGILRGFEEVTVMDVSDGTDGEQGPQGEKGEQGEQGPPGPQGAPGLQGIQGLKGELRESREKMGRTEKRSTPTLPTQTVQTGLKIFLYPTAIGNMSECMLISRKRILQTRKNTRGVRSKVRTEQTEHPESRQLMGKDPVSTYRLRKQCRRKDGIFHHGWYKQALYRAVYRLYTGR